ncbi:MAG: hypothetical protein E6J03_12450 [Chloroflexi bacterium]|nr:MAG: hypothetical protein E6J03_12450 [Chloroflexota bacterium]
MGIVERRQVEVERGRLRMTLLQVGGGSDQLPRRLRAGEAHHEVGALARPGERVVEHAVDRGERGEQRRRRE